MRPRLRRLRPYLLALGPGLLAASAGNDGGGLATYASAAASELFGVPRYVAVPLAAVLVWLLIVRGSYARVEKIFLVLSLAFFAYVGAAFLAHPDWHQVLAETVHPRLRFEAGYLSLLIALIGTTISPYMQLYIQSSVVEKGATPDEYPYTDRK